MDKLYKQVKGKLIELTEAEYAQRAVDQQAWLASKDKPTPLTSEQEAIELLLRSTPMVVEEDEAKRVELLEKFNQRKERRNA